MINSLKRINGDSNAGSLSALCDSPTRARAQAIKRRRQIWEALHPEGKQPSQVGTPVAKHGREQAVEFATDTAAVSGEGRSSIYRHLARADALGDDLERIKGTIATINWPYCSLSCNPRAMARFRHTGK